MSERTVQIPTTIKTTENEMEPKRKMQEQISPPWIKQSMTLLQASNLAAAKGCFLKVSWSGGLGCRIVAVPRGEK